MEQSRHQAEEEQRRQADAVREALVSWGGVGAHERRARGGKERRPDDAADTHSHTSYCNAIFAAPLRTYAYKT